ncbi:MAG: hypothetical protein M0Z89_03060 [Nitrospiraceae bacterium]|nr:hypothetical protein [Nitrospiraceae bacterium]
MPYSKSLTRIVVWLGTGEGEEAAAVQHLSKDVELTGFCEIHRSGVGVNVVQVVRWSAG